MSVGALVTGLVGAITFLYRQVAAAKDGEMAAQRERIAALEREIAAIRAGHERRMAEEQADFERREKELRNDVERWQRLFFEVVPSLNGLVDAVHEQAAEVQRRLR